MIYTNLSLNWTAYVSIRFGVVKNMMYILFDNSNCMHNHPVIAVYPTEEEEAEGSYNIDAGHIIKVPPSRELPSSSILKDPSPSSVVKLEVNQKAKNKRERQELYGE